MDWDAIGAIAELAGAIGVIASLLYLATQIRQNSRQLRGQAQVSFTEATRGCCQSYGKRPILPNSTSG